MRVRGAGKEKNQRRAAREHAMYFCDVSRNVGHTDRISAMLYCLENHATMARCLRLRNLSWAKHMSSQSKMDFCAAGVCNAYPLCFVSWRNLWQVCFALHVKDPTATMRARIGSQTPMGWRETMASAFNESSKGCHCE